MGVFEDMKEKDPAKRFRIEGVEDAEKIRKDFWNTVNSNKVSDNILTDRNVEVVDVDGLQVVCLHVPMAIFRIDGLRYICERITSTFTEQGLSKKMKGLFYRLY